MDEKSNSSMQKKEDASGDKQTEGSSQKITNFFPVLRPEGRAKMCASKTDDSKQKEMVKKLKGKESMTLRSKRQDKVNEKSNSNTINQVKEKVRNVAVASALKTPLGQVLRKSIEASDKKEMSSKSNPTKLPESLGKTLEVKKSNPTKLPESLGKTLEVKKSNPAKLPESLGKTLEVKKSNPTKLPESLGKTIEVKKNLSDSESGRTLRQKTVVSEKPKRPYRRKSEPNQTSTVTENLKAIRVENLKVKTEGHGRPGRPKSSNLIDTVSEEGRSDSNSGNKIRKYRKRHFRGGTYGLYLTPARKKKKKMMSSQDESKDDEGSVTSTENNSFLDSEDANSMVSEDFLTASEKSLVDEEQCLESQTSSLLNSEKKTEKLDFNSSVESKDLSSKELATKEEKPEPKIEISADYEENTQNVTDLFQDLEEMQWESDQKAERADNSNASNNKLAQYDDISNESFTNALHFSFKKASEDSNENLIVEKPEALVDFSSTCDVAEKSNEKIGLSEGSQTCLSNKIPEMFDAKSNSNVNDLKEDKNESSKDGSNVDLKDNSNINLKQDSNVNMKDESNTELKDDSNGELKSNGNLKEDSNVGYKDDSNVDMKDYSNLASSNNSVSKIDLNLLTSDMSQIKEDLNLVSTDIISNRDSLNLLFEDEDDDDDKDDLNISSIVAENKILSDEAADIPEKRNFNLSSVVFNESRENSIQMSIDLNEKVSVGTPPLATKNDDINNSDSHLTSEVKQDSNSVLYAGINKQDSNSLTFPPEDKLESDSITFNENSKNDADSITFSDKQDSNFETLDIEEKQNSNYSLCANEKEVRDSPNLFKSEVRNETNSRDVAENNSGEIEDGNQNKKEIDAESVTFSDKQDSNFETLDVGEKQNSNFSLSASEKEARNTPNLIENEDKMEVNSHSVIENKSDEMQDSNQNKKDYFNNMEVDNQEKDDDDDDQSTIANCVKSRQRIKRRFTDDIVDTDLGILSVAAMASDKASFKKAIIKSDAPKEVIEHFQSVTRTEAKKSGSAAKIECVFNCKQTPIKSCTCEGDSFQAKLDKNEEESFCQAVDSIDDKLLGCTNPVVTSRLVRPSVKHAFTVMCETHLWRLKHHHACPYCGLFCSQGAFIQCTSGANPRSVHLFHEQCQTKEEGTVPFCFHCGSSANLKRVHLELQMANPPAFFLNQASKVSVPDVSKARISFSASADFSKKEDDEPTVSIKIEESGKILSSAGLPNSSSKEELEKLISMLNDDKVQSYNYTSDELYDMATIGDVLKVLYMLVKGCDPNERFPSHEGETALHTAAANGHATIVHLLIQAGAVCDSLNEKMYTSLMLAVENAHKEVVHYLVKKGAITDFRGENGMSSLHLAAKSGNLDILKILMSSRDTDIDAQDDGGWTPIVWASEHDHLNVVKYLLKRGANPNIRDNEGNIGLHWSAFSGSVEISYLYLDYGCDINAVNELGDTPLHIAARQDSFPCVTLFLSRGADVTIVNKAEKIPAECCIDKNSDTYLSLSLNMLLKKITKKYQHKAEKIIHRDISRGKEQIAIQCVNAFDDEMPPLDFLYVTENCETMPINIDRTITSLQSCHCEDDCSTASCSCASISYQCWYDKEGLLLPEFNLLDPPMLFECNRACSCWSLNCHNRVLQNGITCRLQLIRTKGKGWGVRTLKDIPKGAFICEYVGELISDSAADKRADDSYLFDLDNRDGETYCLDARYYGNISRFINHLCEPNLVPVKIYVDHQDLNFPRIAFFSSRDIKQYEELGFDYGEKFWAIKYKSFTCDCGAAKCKYSKDVIHITMANYYRRLKEEQMEEAAAATQQQPMEIAIE